MAKGLRFDNDYLVGGPARAWVTPNFLLSEYAAADGSIYVHRELLAAVQLLRDALGRSVDIAAVTPSGGLGAGLAGRFAWVRAGDPQNVVNAAQALLRDATLERVETRGERVYLQIPDPTQLPPLVPERALERAIRVTAAFETSGDP